MRRAASILVLVSALANAALWVRWPEVVAPLTARAGMWTILGFPILAAGITAAVLAVVAALGAGVAGHDASSTWLYATLAGTALAWIAHAVLFVTGALRLF